MLGNRQNCCNYFHFERPRINRIITEAVKFPLVVICAGKGYGKTRAVHDFLKKEKHTAVRLALTLQDNEPCIFWDNYTQAIAALNTVFAKSLDGLGFPDTVKKFSKYLSIANNFTDMKLRIIVMDNFHLIENRAVICFINQLAANLPASVSLMLVSRTMPCLNADYYISENDLRFNKNELARYFHSEKIVLNPKNLKDIKRDTAGWPFAVNYIAKSYKKAPGYGGYLCNAMKKNIFKMIETDIWDCISGLLKQFLAKLSLISHFPFDLIENLPANNEKLTKEMEKQNAYLRRDNNINAYIFNHLFLEFLVLKQNILSPKQKSDTYRIAAQWCNKNGFINDAMLYYEKIADYKSIVSILLKLPAQIPHDNAKCAAEIFDRTTEETFDSVEFLAVLHLRCNISLGLWQRSIELAEYYEAKFQKIEQKNNVRKNTLCRLYFSWSFLRGLMCTIDDRYDMDVYIEKFCKCINGGSKPDPSSFAVYTPGPWINRAGSSRKGAPDEYIESKARMHKHLANSFDGFRSGELELARGELLFYRGDIRSAESYILNAASLAKKNRQYGILHMALFFTLRISIAEGDYQKVQQALKLMKALTDESNYTESCVNFDLALAWYYIVMRNIEKTPFWIKDNFVPYSHAGFSENFANQIKALYYYSTRNFIPLLLYIKENKQRKDTFLFERVEMLAMEACIYYKMNDKEKALGILYEAYKTALPNKLILPFMELGKDMRTLSSFALKEPGKRKIPPSWLENINKKAALYAKGQSHVIAKYRQANRNTFVISPRESDILSDLSCGLSRGEIASKRNLSINTVKMVIKNIYTKMGAENLADMIRIAVEKKLI